MSAVGAKAGRNALCPCGSGLKLKRCHAAAHRAPTPVVGASPSGPARQVQSGRDRRVARLVDGAASDLAANRFTAAAAGASAVLAIDPKDADALGLLGEVAHIRGQVERAGQLLLAAISARPADPLNRRRLAALLADMGAVDDAIAQLELAIAVATPDAGVHADLAALHARAGRPAESRQSIARAFELEPDNQTALETLVELEMAAADYPAARAGFDALVRKSAQPDPDEHLIAVGPVRAVRDWCLASGDPYTVARKPAPVRIARPRYAGDREPPPPLDVLLPEAYVAEVGNATLVGQEAAVIARDGDVLFDQATDPRGAGRYDFVRGAVRYMDDRSALVHAARPRATIEAGVLLTGPASHNYYHWFLEHLTRFRNLEASPAHADWPLIVDRAAVAVPQLLDALRLAAGAGRDIVVLESGVSARVDRLAVVSPGAWLPLDLRDGLLLEPADSVFDPWAIEFLRERLMPAEVNPDRTGRHGTRRVHLARSQPGRLQSAEALAPVLRDFGFEDVLPETLSFADQVRLFADADVILAETGAALTNFVFAPRSARIVVLGADRWDLTLFSGLAGVLGQELVYVAGTPIRASHRKAYQVRFTLEPARLRRALREILG